MRGDQTTYRFVSKFQEVFSCLFVHEYYLNGVCSEVFIKPTIASNALLSDLQLVFKSTVGGFSLVANSAKDYGSNVFGESFDLNFEFKFTNPFFHIFSELDVNPETRYFLEEDFKKEILFDDSVQSNSPELDRPGISGVLKLTHQENKPLLPRQGSDETVFTPRSKLIRIGSRKIKIVYICYSAQNNLAHLTGLNIEIEGFFKGIVTFSPPEIFQTAAGFAAVRFVTEQHLSMQSSWRGVFRLERMDQLGDFKKSLPNPSPKSIKYDFTTNTFISENYVKL